MDSISDTRVRPLSISDVGIDLEAPETEATTVATKTPRAVEKLESTDPNLIDVLAALDMGFAGVIFSGPPGTGKSYFAERIAHTIAGDGAAVTTIQFHASYQYEDFMQGYTPVDTGGFTLTDKAFTKACKWAADHKPNKHVIVIDEISRCDVARVFGEALTYLEIDKREKPFMLASGHELTVPDNLIILATMNPWDKGVDDLDVALERRFAQIDMLPDANALRAILKAKGAKEDFIERIAAFFEGIQALDDELLRLGHAYFNHCVDEPSAKRAWQFRLLPFFRKACRLDKQMLQRIQRLWQQTALRDTARNVTSDAANPQEDIASAPEVMAAPATTS